MEPNRSFMHAAKLIDAQVPIERDFEYWFHSNMKLTRPRKHAIRAIVLHHTAGEGDGRRIFKTLKERRLSIHFTIDYYGRVVQHADTEVCAFHAREFNDCSIGIELQNYGVERPGSIGARRFPRVAYSDNVHGRVRNFLAFTDAQVESCRSLCESLCATLGIPFKFAIANDGRAYRTALGENDLPRASGILGHYQLTTDKIDPSPHLLDALIRGRKP